MLYSFATHATPVVIPIYACSVEAGFPSPASDFLDQALDIHRHLVARPASTRFTRAPDDSMLPMGIFGGDLLIVDQSLAPSHGDIVLAAADGDTLCRCLDARRRCLRAGDPLYATLPIDPEAGLDAVGVVTASIRLVQKGFHTPLDTDELAGGLDLNTFLIRRPTATYFVRARGDSLIKRGIFDGDILVVDRSIPVRDEMVVIIALNGELTCKILDMRHGHLRAGNDRYPPIAVSEGVSLETEGVVTAAVRVYV